MNLNDEHIELLKQVRERMFKDVEDGSYIKRPYICWNIWLVSNELEDVPQYTVFAALVEEDKNEDVRILIAAIESAINDNCTFSNWLDNQVQDIGLYTHKESAYVLGRLAWLDKMIETRVIA